MGIPGLQEFKPALDNRGAQLRQIPRSKSSRSDEFDWFEPILCGCVTPLDVDVRGFAGLLAVEKESEASQSHNRRHIQARRPILSSSYALTRT
jgi:hypothetical protein